MKFGGTSVADIDRIRNVAHHVKREVDAGHEVAVVVSAMSGTTNELVGWCRAASPLHDAREYDAVVASGEQVTAGPARHHARGHGHQRALLAGLAAADPDQQRARLGAHPRHQRRRADQALQGAQGGRGDRRLPGRPQGHRPHHHARPRRLRHLGGGDRRRHPGRPLRHLHRRRRRLHHRPARGAARPAHGQDRVRGNAGAGLARRQGAAGALGRARHGAQGARSSFARASTSPKTSTRTARRRARSFATRRRSWNSRSSPASPSPRTRRRSRSATCRTSRASPPRSSARWRTPASTST